MLLVLAHEGNIIMKDSNMDISAQGMWCMLHSAVTTKGMLSCSICA